MGAATGRSLTARLAPRGVHVANLGRLADDMTYSLDSQTFRLFYVTPTMLIADATNLEALVAVLNENHRHKFSVITTDAMSKEGLEHLQCPVEFFPVAKGGVPNFADLWKMCEVVDRLVASGGSDAVVAFVSASGRGRASIFAAAALLFTGVCTSAFDALAYIAARAAVVGGDRTVSQIVPRRSQTLWVRYFETLLRTSRGRSITFPTSSPVTLNMVEVRNTGLPDGTPLQVVLYEAGSVVARKVDASGRS